MLSNNSALLSQSLQHWYQYFLTTTNDDKSTTEPPLKPPAAHHAGVEVLVDAAEGVWGDLSFAGQQQGDVGDAQRVEALRVQSPPVRQEHPVGRRGAAGAQAGRAAVGRRLDDVPALLQLLLPLIQNPAGTVCESILTAAASTC